MLKWKTAAQLHTHTHTRAHTLLWYNDTVCLWWTIYTLPYGGWALWRRNLRLPLAYCKALETNWALWHPARYQMWTNERYNLIPYNSRADVVRLFDEQYDSKSKVNWAGFDTSFKCPTCLATLKSCDTTKQSVCGWQYIYIVRDEGREREWVIELGVRNLMDMDVSNGFPKFKFSTKLFYFPSVSPRLLQTHSQASQ